MVYDLIFNELLVIFNATVDTWQYLGVQIIAFTLTSLFVLLFLLIPVYAFLALLSYLNGSEVEYSTSNGFRRSKRAKNRK